MWSSCLFLNFNTTKTQSFLFRIHPPSCFLKSYANNLTHSLQPPTSVRSHMTYNFPLWDTHPSVFSLGPSRFQEYGIWPAPTPTAGKALTAHRLQTHSMLADNSDLPQWVSTINKINNSATHIFNFKRQPVSLKNLRQLSPKSMYSVK